MELSQGHTAGEGGAVMQTRWCEGRMRTGGAWLLRSSRTAGRCITIEIHLITASALGVFAKRTVGFQGNNI